ncbi:MAG: tetratricopeptide repeat protein [Acidobacteriaceae bacterium]|nr:tetratricopeptide repeat protein [Acidobacteriaceae bacterium]
MKARFAKFVEAGYAQSYDWAQEAWHLLDLKAYADSGETYLEAASKFNNYTFVCEAADSFYFGGDLDRALSSARDCIKQAEGKEKSAGTIASARARIADALNQRGVYEEALSQITQALVTEPNNASFLDTKARALYGAGRYAESATASKAAIQASDGKYGWMHFQLGLAYFKLRDWESAKDSFERAANLDPNDPEAAYNVAASYQNMHSRRDAIAWYKQVISRDATYAQKNDVAGSIADLERQLQQQ